MFQQSNGRNQRPKGFKVKQAFQVILLLAVSIWLLYQIKHSSDKPKEYGGLQKKLRIEHGSMILGRKGDAGSSDGVDTDSDEVNPVGKGERKDGGGGDDELDRNLEEKAQDKSFINGHEDSQEKITNHDEKDDAKELETQDRESQRSEENNLGTQVREGDEAVGSDKGEEEPLNKGHEDSEEGFTNNVEQEDREMLETQNEEPQNIRKGNLDTEEIDREETMSSHKQEEEPLNKGNEDSKESFTENVEHEDRKKLETQNEESENSEKGKPDAEVIGRDEASGSVKDNDEGKDSKGNAEDIVMQHNETESITAPGRIEMGDGLQGFNDENGVPPDGHDLLNTHSNGTTSLERDTTTLDHETISSLENQTQLVEFTTQMAGESSNSSQVDEQTDRGMLTDNLVIKQDEVRSQESGNFAEVETVSNNTLEGSKTESNDNVENSSQSGDDSDVSSIKGKFRTPDASVSSESYSSGSSQKENEEATSVKMLSKAEM